MQDAGDSDSEDEQAKLSEFESALKEHDAAFAAEMADQEAAAGVCRDSPEWHQIHLATERIRVAEILFQVRRPILLKDLLVEVQS